MQTFILTIFGRLAAILIFLAIVSTSCKKFTDIKPAPDLIQTDNVFTSDKTALSAASGVYLTMRSVNVYYCNVGMAVFGGLSSDEISSAAANYEQFTNNELLPSNTLMYGNIWKVAYQLIYKTNAIIEGLSGATGLTDSVKNQLTGEMKLVRAFNYFYLVNLFGDIPLILTTDYKANTVMPRTPAVQIYAQMVADLKDAETLMQPIYPSSGKLRPNRFTATSLLARVYLYLKDWMNADSEVTALINSGLYSLATITTLFQKNSSETIWEITSNNELLNTEQAGVFIPATATSIPPFPVSNSLLAAFEPGDLRKQNWLKSTTIGNPAVTYYYPYKYKERSATSPVKECNIIFRLAEFYLVRAEAKAMQNDFPAALRDINSIRARAGLPAFLANNRSEILVQIEKERQAELFLEWGDRWLNLKRTDRADGVLGTLKGSFWQSTDKQYPIPSTELTYNPFLVQNPGY